MFIQKKAHHKIYSGLLIGGPKSLDRSKVTSIKQESTVLADWPETALLYQPAE